MEMGMAIQRQREIQRHRDEVGNTYRETETDVYRDGAGAGKGKVDRDQKERYKDKDGDRRNKRGGDWRRDKR